MIKRGKMLEPHRGEILRLLRKPGMTYKLIHKTLNDEMGIKCSQRTVEHFCTSLKRDVQEAKEIKDTNKMLDNTEKTRKVFKRLEKIVDDVEPIYSKLVQYYGSLSAEELSKVMDFEKLINSLTKGLELMGKINGEIQTGSKNTIYIGQGLDKCPICGFKESKDKKNEDKLFLEFVKQKIEKETNITFEMFIEEYRRWKITKGRDQGIDIVDV